jgi:hypothetical protein
VAKSQGILVKGTSPLPCVIRCGTNGGTDNIFPECYNFYSGREGGAGTNHSLKKVAAVTALLNAEAKARCSWRLPAKAAYKPVMHVLATAGEVLSYISRFSDLHIHMVAVPVATVHARDSPIHER